MNRWTRIAITLAFYSAVSALWSWPFVTDPLNLRVERHFDGYVATWFGGFASRVIPWSWTSPDSAWPDGEILSRADSLVLVLVGHLTRWIAPTAPGAFCILLGPVLSAFAAERVAARLGATFPASLLAGLAYGFSSLSSIALLEGHHYAILNPWMPLCLYAAVEAYGTGTDAPEWNISTRRWAFGVAAAWFACLATTAYSGLAASVLVLALWVEAAWRRPASRRAIAASLAAVFVVGATYSLQFILGGGGISTSLAHDIPAMGAIRLGVLAGWTPAADFSNHSLTPTIPVTCAALAAFGVVRFQDLPLRFGLGLAVVLAIALAFGAEVSIVENRPGLSWIFKFFYEFEALRFIRFPLRFVQTAWLALAVLGALSASRVATGRAMAILLALGVGDVLLHVGTPFRTARLEQQPPSALNAAPEGWAIINLEPVSNALDLNLVLSNRGCSWQAWHRRPVLQTCFSARLGPPASSPAQTYLTDALFHRRDPSEWLLRLGIGSVSFEPELFPDPDRTALRRAAIEAFGNPAESFDHGIHLLLFEVPGRPPGVPDRDTAKLAWKSQWG